MKKIIYIILSLFVFSCTTKQNVIDTGLVDLSPYPGTVMDYLRQDTMNFKEVVHLIEFSGLTDLFEGKIDSLPEITFFTAKGWMYPIKILQSENPETVKNYLLNQIVSKKILSTDFTDNPENVQFLGGLSLPFWAQKINYMGMAEGALNIYYHLPGSWRPNNVRTSNIITKNGVIHRWEQGMPFN